MSWDKNTDKWIEKMVAEALEKLPQTPGLEHIQDWQGRIDLFKKAGMPTLIKFLRKFEYYSGGSEPSDRDKQTKKFIRMTGHLETKARKKIAKTEDMDSRIADMDLIDRRILELVTKNPDLKDEQIGVQLAEKYPYDIKQIYSREAINRRRKKLEVRGHKVR